MKMPIIDPLYRLYVFIRRIPHVFDRVCFVPLRYDSHVVWDVHRKFLQYKTAPVLPGKILHVINRVTSDVDFLRCEYISELESIYSLLPRSILKSQNYQDIKDALRKVLLSGKLRGIIFQSPGAFAANERWLKGVEGGPICKIITVVPAELEDRVLPKTFVDKDSINFLMFASKYYEKGLHIFFAVAEKLKITKSHYKFTLVTSKPVDYLLPDNVKNLVIPGPTLKERRSLYTGHDYVINLSLGDSLGVFLDALRFGTPMIGYRGQHGDTYCTKNTSIMMNNPIFIYGENFLEKYNMFEYEMYLKKLEEEGFFEKNKQELFEVLGTVDNFENYSKMVLSLKEFSKQFSSTVWIDNIRKFYKLFN